MAQAIPDVTENANKPNTQQKPKDRDNFIYIGKKPTMSYVLAVMTQIQGGATDLHIKARGKNISRAVDVAEVVRNRFAQDMSRRISIDTETVEDKAKNKLNVSTIDIRLTK
ncbi:MAG: DNA-binding protein Alba [Candidatus Aenigmatarchaeota archaeon]|nr:MAG: DNA-binding protein Alba [Candidatus Aenigmarchaeota archaeon]